MGLEGVVGDVRGMYVVLCVDQWEQDNDCDGRAAERFWRRETGGSTEIQAVYLNVAWASMGSNNLLLTIAASYDDAQQGW